MVAVPAWLGAVGLLAFPVSQARWDSLLVLYLPSLALAVVTIVIGLLPPAGAWRGPQSAGG